MAFVLSKIGGERGGGGEVERDRENFYFVSTRYSITVSMPLLMCRGGEGEGERHS